eukprot:g29338.t1
MYGAFGVASPSVPSERLLSSPPSVAAASVKLGRAFEEQVPEVLVLGRLPPRQHRRRTALRGAFGLPRGVGARVLQLQPLGG